jgi:hypothetical protein
MFIPQQYEEKQVVSCQKITIHVCWLRSAESLPGRFEELQASAGHASFDTVFNLPRSVTEWFFSEFFRYWHFRLNVWIDLLRVQVALSGRH